MKRRTYHFAFIFHRKRLIVVGVNGPYDYDSRTIYFGHRFNITKYKHFGHPHAETDAVGKCWGKVTLDSSHTMIVLRINNRGELYNSQPCENCQEMIDQIGFRDVWWSNNEGHFTNPKGQKIVPEPSYSQV